MDPKLNPTPNKTEPPRMTPPLKSKGLGSNFIGPNFEDLGIIGSGSYGEVHKVRHIKTKVTYAVKRYRKIFTNRILALRTLR
jgi:serine/threonine protein kinase